LHMHIILEYIRKNGEISIPGMLLSFSVEPDLSHASILYYCLAFDTNNIK
jgi:hypothetical protein